MNYFVLTCDHYNNKIIVVDFFSNEGKLNEINSYLLPVVYISTLELFLLSINDMSVFLPLFQPPSPDRHWQKHYCDLRGLSHGRSLVDWAILLVWSHIFGGLHANGCDPNELHFDIIKLISNYLQPVYYYFSFNSINFNLKRLRVSLDFQFQTILIFIT